MSHIGMDRTREWRCDVTKKVQMILAFVRKNRREAEKAIRAMDAKRKEQLRKGTSFAYWAEWNLLDYVRAEALRSRWESVENNLVGGLADGRTEKDIIEYLEGYREGIVEQVMQHSPKRSTNPVANLIEEVEVGASREVAGANMLDGGSLTYLLFKLKSPVMR